jgi:hypothetical protein
VEEAVEEAGVQIEMVEVVVVVGGGTWEGRDTTAKDPKKEAQVMTLR